MKFGDCEGRSSYIGVNIVLSHNNLQYANYSFSLCTLIYSRQMPFNLT